MNMNSILEVDKHDKSIIGIIQRPEIPNLVLDIGLKAKATGNDVSLYLVEDGVTAARKSEFGNKLQEAKKKGIKILADDKAVQSRGLDGNLVDWVLR